MPNPIDTACPECAALPGTPCVGLSADYPHAARVEALEMVTRWPGYGRTHYDGCAEVHPECRMPRENEDIEC